MDIVHPHDTLVLALVDECGSTSGRYSYGLTPPNYSVPALRISIEYVFGHGLVDGVFIRNERDEVVNGAYKDGLYLDYNYRGES